MEVADLFGWNLGKILSIWAYLALELATADFSGIVFRVLLLAGATPLGFQSTSFIAHCFIIPSTRPDFTPNFKQSSFRVLPRTYFIKMAVLFSDSLLPLSFNCASTALSPSLPRSLT